MSNNKWHQVLSGLSGVVFATVHAAAAEEEEEEVTAASLQHLRMETLAMLSKSLFLFVILQQQQQFRGFHRRFRSNLELI